MLQQLDWQAFQQRDVRVFVYREDLNHPFISGNKLYKLNPLLDRYNAGERLPVVSFGGPYSNHLYALAWLCHQLQIPVIGIVRGLHHTRLSATLNDVQDWGMMLSFVSNREYRQWCSMSVEQASEKARDRFGPCYLIPEGGATSEVVQAYQPLAVKIYQQLVPDYLFCPTGTGSTLAGLFKYASQSQVHGIQCVAEGTATRNRINRWLDSENLHPDLVFTDFHRGGFARTDTELLAFCKSFQHRFSVPLEPVYTGKAFMAVYQLLLRGYFKPGSRVVVVHTGGLQGNRGFAQQYEQLDLGEFAADPWHFN